MARTYDVVITRQYSWAYTTVKADSPQHALQKIRRRIAEDDDYEEFDYEHFDDIGEVNSITIECAGQILAEFIDPGALLGQHAESLLSAAEEVLRNWESGNLAAAVSNLADAVTAAKGGDA